MARPSKLHTKQSESERSAIAALDQAVGALGHVWRETRNTDVGFDGQVELIDTETRGATGIHVGVQVKSRQDAGTGFGDTFAFGCPPKDVDYWLASNLPVLLVLYNPVSRELWAKDVRAWFRAQPGQRSTGKVVFDRTEDRLTDPVLFGLLDPDGGTVVPAAPPRTYTDRAILNIVPVTKVPETVWCAPSPVTGWPGIAALFDTPDAAEFLIDAVSHAGKVWATAPFDTDDRAKVVNGPVTELRFEKLAGNDTHLATRLLYGTLRAQTNRDLRFVGGTNPFSYFRAQGDEPVVARGVARGPGRTVVSPQQRKDGSGVSGYRHYALRSQLLHLDEQWHLAIDHDYHFTVDGIRESKFAGEKRAGMARRERNPARRDLIRFWAAWLRNAAPTLHDQVDRQLSFGDLVPVDIDDATVDDSWVTGPPPPPPTAGDRPPAPTFDGLS